MTADIAPDAGLVPSTHRRVPRWAFLPFLAMSIVHVAALAFQIEWLATPTKLLLMPLLAFAVLLGARGIQATGAVTLLLVAQFCSWIGDGAAVFLPFLPTIPAMLAFFGLAHVAYVLLFFRRTAIRRLPMWSAVYLAWWGVMLLVVGPYAGDLLLPLAGYGVLLALTAATATRCRPFITSGAAIFLVSDSLLAFQLFRPDVSPWWFSPLIMLTYTLGQAMIAAGTLAELRERNR